MFNAEVFRTYRLSPGGVECDEGGISVGGVPLLISSSAPLAKRRWRTLPASEFDAALGRAYGIPVQASEKMNGLKVIADALNNGELARAQIAAVLLRLPDPPQLRKNAAVGAELAAELTDSGFIVKDWNPDEHPRTGEAPNPGWFAPKDGDGAGSFTKPEESPSATGSPDGRREYALAGRLVGRIYNRKYWITHCTYDTPIEQFTVEWEGNVDCDLTSPYPY